MGEAKRKKAQAETEWPQANIFRGTIDLHALPPVAAINGTRIRKLTGDDAIPKNARIILRAFLAIADKRNFHVGFCIGDGAYFSAIGLAVIDRLMMEVPDAPVHVVPVAHHDIAWDIVISHLRSFTGQTLLFAFPDSDVYDAGTAEIHYSKYIRQFAPDGAQLKRLSAAQRRKILQEKAVILDRPPPPTFYPADDAVLADTPWIFRLATPAGKILRTAVWDGRRDYAHELPEDIMQWVGGDKIAVVQVDSPVGVNRRSSLDLTHRLSGEYDGIIHWARDTETFKSILNSFVRLDLETVSPPKLPEGWEPEIVILAANGDHASE